MHVKRNFLSFLAGAVFAVFVVPTASAETITSVGSDTLEVLMHKWSAAYKQANTGVSFSVESKGSGTAPPALTAGTSQLGPMSRKMKPEEMTEFELVNGYKPTAVRVAIDALGVFVHKDNPVQGLTLAEVDALFSSDRKCGHPEAVTKWGQVGVGGALADASVTVFSRDASSGTRAYFEKKALCKGGFVGTVREFSTSPEMMAALAADPSAIGYAGAGLAGSGARLVPIAKRSGKPYTDASPENAANGSYPMARFLYIYVDKRPGEPLPEAVGAFMSWILSPAGQAIVADNGFTPLNDGTVAKQIQLVAAN